MLTHRKNRRGWLPRIILLGIISGVVFFVYDNRPEPTDTPPGTPTTTATVTVNEAETTTPTPEISLTPSLTLTPLPTPTLLPAFSPDATGTPFTRPTKPIFEPGKQHR